MVHRSPAVTRTAGELLGSAADATAALGISVTSAVSVREMSRADAMQTVARITSGGDAQDRGDGRSGASLLASDLALEAEGDNDSSSSAQAYVIVTILASVGGAFVVRSHRRLYPAEPVRWEAGCHEA
jgi:hypothetical protein